MSPGEQLQSERELSQRFQVSPMTVRRALHKLSTEGYTSAIPGKGTFVRKCFYAKRADTSSFTDSMLAAGKVASAHLISATLRQATRGEEEALGIDKNILSTRFPASALGMMFPYASKTQSSVRTIFRSS